MIYCANCGKGIPDESNFCTFCGAVVPTVAGQASNTTGLLSGTASPATTAAVSTNQGVPFFKNPGFYGAVIVLIGYFFIWLNNWDNTGIELVSYFGADHILV